MGLFDVKKNLTDDAMTALDEDVITEEKRINALTDEELEVKVKNLRKVYR